MGVETHGVHLGLVEPDLLLNRVGPPGLAGLTALPVAAGPGRDDRVDDNEGEPPTIFLISFALVLFRANLPTIFLADQGCEVKRRKGVVQG